MPSESTNAELKDKARAMVRDAVSEQVAAEMAEEKDAIRREVEDMATGAIKQALASAGKVRGLAERKAGLPEMNFMVPDGSRARQKGESGTFHLRIPTAPNQVLWPAKGMSTRSITDSEDVAGGVETSLEPWSPSYESMSPFRAAGAVVKNVTGGVVKVPAVGAFTMSNEAAHPGATDRTLQGALTSADTPILNYVAEALASEAAIMDVNGLADSIGMALMEAAMEVETTLTANAIITSAKAGGSGSIQVTPTGVADMLPAAANRIAKVSELKAAIPVARRGTMPAFVGHTAVESVLETAALSGQAGYAFDASVGVDRLLKWPFYPTDSLEDGGAANEVSLVGGNFSRGVCILSRYIDVKVSDTTRMGAWTFFATHRTAAVVTYAGALRAWQTKVS
ncbi:MAG: hypothetical protein OXC08_11835 [Thiotrichales bacterium]|nr:hypothetical protein [Thiotrichales bacterium]